MTHRRSSAPACFPRILWLPVVLTLLAGCYWRALEVERALLFGDELHSVRAIAAGYESILTTYHTGAGLALPLLQRIAADLIGLHHGSIRLPPLLGGLLLLGVAIPLATPLVGRAAACGVAMLLATNSCMIFYSHFGRAYTLAVLVAFCLVALCQRVAASLPLTRSRALAIAVLSALHPYIHPTALGFALPVLSGLGLALLAQPERRRECGLLGVAVLLGSGLALLAHLPAWESMREFVGRKATAEYFGAFGPVDIAAVLAGSRSGAWITGSLAALGLIGMLVRERARSLPLVLGCVGPGLALAASRPFGDAYAYARYAICSLPCCYLAIGWLIQASTHKLRSPLQATVSLAIGAALAWLLFALGPNSFLPDEREHANTYLSLYALDAFDRPYPGMPDFYRSLDRSSPVRLLEAPMLTTRTRHLYRNYSLQHQQQICLAPFPWELSELPGGPYFSLDSDDWREASRADYLVVHRDIAQEVEAYWRFVSSQIENLEDPTARALHERHSRYGVRRLRKPPAEMLTRLYERLGSPTYEDRWLLVWDLRKPS